MATTKKRTSLTAAQRTALLAKARAHKKTRVAVAKADPKPRYIKTVRDVEKLRADLAAGRKVVLSESQIGSYVGGWDASRPITGLLRLVVASAVAQTGQLSKVAARDIWERWESQAEPLPKDAAKAAELLEVLGFESLAQAKKAAKKLAKK